MEKLDKIHQTIANYHLNISKNITNNIEKGDWGDPEGTIKEWKNGKMIKKNGKWVPYKESTKESEKEKSKEEKKEGFKIPNSAKKIQQEYREKMKIPLNLGEKFSDLSKEEQSKFRERYDIPSHMREEEIEKFYQDKIGSYHTGQERTKHVEDVRELRDKIISDQKSVLVIEKDIKDALKEKFPKFSEADLEYHLNYILDRMPEEMGNYIIKWSVPNQTYQIWEGKKLISDFKFKEKALDEAEKLGRKNTKLSEEESKEKNK